MEPGRRLDRGGLTLRPRFDRGSRLTESRPSSKGTRLTRFALLAVSLAAFSTLAVPAGAAAQGCLAYDEPTTILSGTVYAMEAFDEAEADTVERPRNVDYYALVMPERVCISGAPGDAARPETHHITVVRLDMPVEMARTLVQKRIAVQGPLSATRDPAADPPLVMKVQALQAGPRS